MPARRSRSTFANRTLKAVFSNASCLAVLIMGCLAMEAYAMLERPAGVAASCLAVMPWLAALFLNLHKKGGAL